MTSRICTPRDAHFQWQATVLAALIAVVVSLSPALAAGRNVNPGVLPPGSTPYGKSYSQWTAEWWKWAYSVPVDQNPFFDESGCDHGASGQSGPVWFLTGVINASGAAERNCTVPAGKGLFFPILNIECATLEGNGETEAELRACTEFFMAFATDLVASVDGVPVGSLGRYRVASPIFTYGPLPENNVPALFGFDAPAGATSLAVSDGFWLMLAPLSAGHHTVHFGGTFADPFNFTLTITYHLTVQ